MCKSVNILVFRSYQCCPGALKRCYYVWFLVTYTLKTDVLSDNSFIQKLNLSFESVELTLIKLDLTWLRVNSTLSLSWMYNFIKVLSLTELTRLTQHFSFNKSVCLFQSFVKTTTLFMFCYKLIFLQKVAFVNCVPIIVYYFADFYGWRGIDIHRKENERRWLGKNDTESSSSMIVSHYSGMTVKNSQKCPCMQLVQQ